ncbi:hypothetical protein FSP39_012015 [Pinctada imbricata]|uniref:C2H2-type domain-containing protein n=1 Tax=Pinctada imbricata TaxID=66713 RepID=A0AA88Y056_PINIB|nr:hypothetical protein FSP39_012015 [Pinctada imbricata]
MKLLSEKFEPLQSQLTRPFESLGKSMKSYYLKKADECVHMVLGIIAPDQESVILSALQSKTMKAETDITTLTAETDMTTKSIISAYHNAADGRTQTQILSLIANDHTKTKLQELIPGISTFKIDNARKHALVQGPGLILSQPKVYRIKLTKPKLNHFIEFILNPTYSSIVGFGQTTLRLSSNAKIEVPKIIRNVISSRIINTYTAYCLENDFPCFSRASLYRILKVCYASKQKALQGLDNITASGLNAVDILHKIVSKLEAYGITQGESKNLNDILHLVNQFLKFEYKMHLCKLDGCVDHCTVFGLSDPLEPKFSSACSHTHEITCDKCSMVESSIHIIREKMHSVFVHVPDSIQEELTHDIDVAEKDLLDWKKHIMRTLHQDKAKTEVLQSMNSDQGLIIMDWAMKYLPFQFRETQSDFFGKRGMSWHVSCLVTKSSNEDEDLDLQSYIHIFENGSQGWFSVANILLHLFDHLSVSKPELKEVFLKSDNAACYHCSNLLGFLQQNNSMFPIQVKQYNFSEPQSGKDLCDSKTGSCRLHMLKHTNEGNNILSPQDMKMALESHGGVKGTQASVVTVPNETEAKTRYKIPQITTLNNFTFTEEGIVARKAYSIGEGQIIGNTNDINLSIEKVRKMQVLQPFCEGAQLKGKVSLPKRTQDTTALEQDQQEAIDSSMETNCEENCAYFSCPDRSCNKTFAKSCNLERHIQVGTHTYENTMPGMDMAITIYAEKTETMKQYQNSILVENQQCYSSIDQEDDKKGWALKSKRQASRFSPKVKDYIKSVCVSCEKSGNRPDVYALSEELKKVTDENGQKLFKQCEWLSPNQIRGCIAQFLTKMKKGPSEPKKSKVCAEEISKTEVDDDALLEVVEMLNESELGENVCGLVSEVFSVIGT